jgi:ATP-dependent Clp protease ATP-binding subunit ClpC
LKEKDIKLEVTEAAKDFLGEKGYDEVFGARPLRRVIQNMVEDKLSEDLLRSEFKVFESVFEIKATIKKPEAITRTIKAVKEIPGILGTESSGDSLTIFSTKSIKYEIEEIIKRLIGLEEVDNQK